MRLFLEINPFGVRACLVDSGYFAEQAFSGGAPEAQKIFDWVLQAHGIDVVSYCFFQGGNLIDESATMIDGLSLKWIAAAVKFSPENNQKTFDFIRLGMKRWPEAKHVLLCESAFFTRLPDYVSTYGVPYEYAQQGIRKYGKRGLAHQRAWKMAAEHAMKPLHRLISVYLDNDTNVAAIQDGCPIEVSDGFSGMGEILSESACGSIDLSIIFKLISSGATLESIRNLLSHKSGFKALARAGQKECALKDILQRDDAAAKLTADLYRYHLSQHIGAYISALGGLDAIVFMGDVADDTINLALEIMGRFSFMGVVTDKRQAKDGFFRLTAPESAIEISYWEPGPWWKMPFDETEAFLADSLTNKSPVTS